MISRSAVRFVGSAAETAASIGGYLGFHYHHDRPRIDCRLEGSIAVGSS